MCGRGIGVEMKRDNVIVGRESKLMYVHMQVR